MIVKMVSQSGIVTKVLNDTPSILLERKPYTFELPQGIDIPGSMPEQESLSWLSIQFQEMGESFVDGMKEAVIEGFKFIFDSITLGTTEVILVGACTYFAWSCFKLMFNFENKEKIMSGLFYSIIVILICRITTIGIK